jgi:hypothetical protein
MRRVVLLSSVLLCAFGVALYSSSRRPLTPPKAFLTSAASPTVVSEKEGGVRIEFREIEVTNCGSFAEFRFVNSGTESLYYPGYSKDDHCSYKIKHKGTVAQNNPCWCGTGLAERVLEPGETATYKVDIRRESGRIQVGFDFQAGKNRHPQTFWSDEIITF